MDTLQAISSPGQLLSSLTITQTIHQAFSGKFSGARLLVIIPDSTRTIPLPFLFRALVTALHDVQRLDFIVALGTHPPLDDEELCHHVGITLEERQGPFRHIGLFNHTWDQDDNLALIGTLPQEQVKEIAGDLWHPSLGGDVPVRINRRIFDYDQLVILSPVFPHEIVGVSGGAKYLFPGISGPEIIDVSHWLGALIGVANVIGIRNNPVREMIHAAAALVPVPVTLVAMVVEGDGLGGIFIGDLIHSWQAAADLTCQRHIIWCDHPFDCVLSWIPSMYGELWTGAKGMYKLEPVVADGGELILYAPHLDIVSLVHGRYLYQLGYHVLPYFIHQWDRFKKYPLAVLGHSTQLRGAGQFLDGVEKPRIKVTLASRISQEDCEQLCLGYMNPNTIKPEEWNNQEVESVLFVPRAGETLYRLQKAGFQP